MMVKITTAAGLRTIPTGPRAGGAGGVAIAASLMMPLPLCVTDSIAQTRPRRRRPSPVDVAATRERPAQRDLVGVLEVAAHREPTRDPRDAHTELLHRARDEHRGRVAFDVGVGREDDFGDALVGNASEQLLDAQLLRPDALDGRDRALQP